MALQISLENVDDSTVRLFLDGLLDAVTANDLESSIQANLTATTKTLILDLQRLSFISSAGLRVLAKSRKTMKSREGKVYFTNPTPQVKKVFDIVQAVPVSEVFANTQELDAYLAVMQSKAVEEENN